jgi:3alpha(or 20beta)-hydroxysteroid dehydrogenase
MTDRLAGKTAIITGGARGTGEATARRFVAEGARVVIADILDDLGSALASELGGAALFVHLDVSDEAQWGHCRQQAIDRFGQIDVLVNNAAVLHLAPIEETKLEDWDRLIRVNQTGVFLGIKTIAPALREAGGGSIVNVSSIDGLEGMNYVGAYSATKWALRGLTKCAALELGRSGIRVNTVCPAGGSEEMQAPWRPSGASANEDTTGYMDKRPINRRGTVEEIASMILYLASDEASFCTGGDYPIDGGHSCGSMLEL